MAAAPEGDKWECPVCLFENITKNGGVCEFCGETAPWALGDGALKYSAPAAADDHRQRRRGAR